MQEDDTAISGADPDATLFPDGGTATTTTPLGPGVKVDPGLPPNVFVALGRMLEPIVGQRVQSATEVRAMLRDPGRALAPRGPSALATVNRGDVVLANVCIATSGAAAAGIYLVFFDAMSETVLVQVSALWIGPLIFGVALAVLARQGVEHAKSKAAAIAGAGLLALIVFFFAIFPAL